MRIGMVLSRVDLNDGVASHLDTLVTELDRAGHDVVLMSGPVSYPVPNSPVWEQREASLRKATRAWERGSFSSTRACAKWLRGAIARNPVDVLHLHGMRLVPAVRLAAGWSLPMAAMAHPSRTSTPDPSSAKQRLLRLATPIYRKILPERALAGSTEIAEWYANVMQFPADRIRMVYYGCDTHQFTVPSPDDRAAARASLGLLPSTLVCVMVGRFDPGKRHETAVKALARLASEGRDVALVIAGSGDCEGHVASLRRAADPEAKLQLRCLNNVDNVRAVYAAGDAIVHPSEREAFALVVAEAMLCGLVPLRTSTGGARDQIHEGVTGFVFDVGDDVRLADRLRWLLDHPAERGAMGRAAATHAAGRFAADAMVRNATQAYRELIGATPLGEQ
jgi:glycosyltransferase involved in cell wall biosynthesis